MIRHELVQSDIGPLPADWAVTTVGREYHVQLGKMLDASRNVGERKPYIGNRAVQWGQVDVTDLPTVPMTKRDLDRFRLRPGDLLVCEGGEIGRAAIWNGEIPEVYYQKALHRLRPKKGFNSQFLMQLLRLWSGNGRLLTFATQTSIAHLPKDTFEAIQIPCPESAEQSAIARALCDMDSLIASLRTLISKKTGIKQGVMQRLIRGEFRLPGFSGKWVETDVGAIADVRTGPFGAQLHEHDYVPVGTPIITVEHLGELGIEVDETVPMVGEEDLKRLARYRLRSGDIVFSRVGSIDRSSLVTSRENGWLFSGRLLRVRPHKDIVSHFLNYQFKSEWFISQIRSSAVGQTMASLNTKILSGCKVYLPEKSEQSQIANVLSSMDAELIGLRQKKVALSNLRQGMMQQLLTGSSRLA